MSIRVSCRVLLFFLLLLIGGAREAPAAIPGVPPPGLQSDPAAAAHDSLLYAVWTDGRLGSSGRLFWTRFQEPVSDSIAAPVTGGGAAELRAAVGAGPGWALAVWEAWTANGTRIQAAELPREGLPGPCNPWMLTADPGPVWRPAAAVSGETGVLVWEDERDAPGDLYFTRWDRGTGPRDPGGAPFAVGPEDERWVRVAAGPAGFVVVWARSAGAGDYEVVARALDGGGDPAGPVWTVSGLEPFTPIPDVACGNGRCLAVWRTGGEGGGDLAGRFLGAQGEPLGEGPVSLAGGPGFEFFPRVAPADSGFALVWLVQDETGRALRRAWVDATGRASPEGGLVLEAGDTYCADAALAGWRGLAAALWRVPLPADDDDLFLAGFDPASAEPVAAVPLTLVASSVGLEAPVPQVRLCAYPNPFADRTRLEIVDREGVGPVDVYDVLGRRVRRLRPAAGSVIWDGRDAEGAASACGVYFVRVPGSTAGLRLVRIP